jgi:cell division septation protein DedD
VEAKRRIKKRGKLLKKSCLSIGVFSGILVVVASIFFLSPLWREIFKNPPAPPPTPPKDTTLDFPLTFYHTLSEVKGERERERKYTVQVSAFKYEASAKKLVVKLKKKGYSAYLASTETPSGEAWHRVRIGYFPTREAAQKFAREVEEKEKLSTLVVRRGD